MIWEPFILALVLGIIVSAGLYFAYLWPSVEPAEPPPDGSDLAVPVGAALGGSAAVIAPAGVADGPASEPLASASTDPDAPGTAP